MARAGHEVQIAAGRGEQVDEDVEFIPIYLADSRHPEILAAKQQLDAGKVPPEFPALVSRLYHALRDAFKGIDCVIAHNVCSLNKNLMLTAAIQRLDRPRKILWHHDLAWTNELYRSQLHAGYPWNLLREPWTNVQPVTVSKTRQVELARLYGIDQNSIKVIPPGIDPADFFRWTPLTRELVAKLKLLSADMILLHPARITKRKNIELGLRVLAQLRQVSHLDARLIVSGPPGAHNPANDEYLQSLLSLRRELNLDQSAHFLYECGAEDQLMIPDDTLADLYTLADALFFPSQQEGFGIPLLEAGLTRLPIFCADIPVLHETGQADVHYFSPDADPIELARLIERELTANRSYRLYRRLRRNYSWHSIFIERIVPLLTKRTQP